mmetsp:Transcript_44009/g.121779  ORF Transcript_44009/g.121779 Transcript_44009/m.121779 type:complete len:80 (+) Transcript_44009:1234-1473(+)
MIRIGSSLEEATLSRDTKARPLAMERHGDASVVIEERNALPELGPSLALPSWERFTMFGLRGVTLLEAVLGSPPWAVFA